MIGIIETTSGVLREVVDDLDGVDLTGCHTTDVPEGWPDDCVWDVELQGFVPPPLDPLRHSAKAAVDAHAARLRAEALTDGFGQEMLYLAKECEARACAFDAVPVVDAYPLLAAEVGITGDTLAEVAVAVIIRADESKAALAAIEAVRLSAKRQINEATDAEEITGILPMLVWPAL
ncbi:hypothetical protein [Kordiimonas aestuarii]|uniref:hypothetical protein n=1 Tax=Kordiimonas aestuarii TaxID=1005925 RepID=UPI0021D19568|nr:hypothetical protein [Kordiimonas aestuarii]